MKRFLAIAAILAVLLAGNAILPRREYFSPRLYDIVIRAGITIVLAVSLNLINGFTGQFSLGHAGFMALGAYMAGSLTYHFGMAWEQVLPVPAALSHALLFVVALLSSAMLAALAGLLMGIPLLRLRGDYLAIATLGFGEIVGVLIRNLDFVGGSRGMPDVPAYTNFFWVYLAVVGVIVMVRNLAHSSHGRAFLSIREDEVAAEAMGIDTTRYKVLAFVIGSAWAGIAGGLYGHYVTVLHPDSFTFLQSIELVVIVVLGGMGSILGSVVTAALLKIIEEALRSVEGAAVVFYLFILFDALLSYSRYRGRRGLFVVKLVAYTVLVTLGLLVGSDRFYPRLAAIASSFPELRSLIAAGHNWIADNIGPLRGVFYALLLILLMLTRPRGLFARSDTSSGWQAWLARVRRREERVV